jgi:hypothetical protein
VEFCDSGLEDEFFARVGAVVVELVAPFGECGERFDTRGTPPPLVLEPREFFGVAGAEGEDRHPRFAAPRAACLVGRFWDPYRALARAFEDREWSFLLGWLAPK